MISGNIAMGDQVPRLVSRIISAKFSDFSWQVGRSDTSDYALMHG
jgi:hypothetical protein